MECGEPLHCHYAQVHSDPVKALCMYQMELLKIIRIRYYIVQKSLNKQHKNNYINVQ